MRAHFFRCSPSLFRLTVSALGALACLVPLGCGSDDSSSPAQADGSAPGDGSVPNPVTGPDGGGITPTDGPSGDGNGSTPLPDGGGTGGWLHTQGGKILKDDGSPWMGRGVNVDDVFFCGYNDALWMPTPEQTLTTLISGLIATWKPSFLRISLAMNSHSKVTSWLTNPTQYKTPMVNVINAIGAHPNLYLLVTLRSDASMIGEDMTDGDPEATGLPSDSTTTPNATSFPTGTDATYVALVDTFASSSFVMFGLTNEPGGNKLTSAKIAAAMDHAVGVIRAEEDKLHVPHHIVSVQGNGWTSDLSYYATTPIAHDNVVYEMHGYPPKTAQYTYANLPVIIGEYGTLSDSAAFFADMEAKQIPNLAWDFDSFSNCAPDLLNVNQSATNLTPTAWGTTVQAYLLAHAPP